MTPSERANDILKRCWWKESDGGPRPEFKGLDVEIVAAINAAVAAEREACACLADIEHEDGGESVDEVLTRLAAAIRARGRQP
jgi:hypothetical protein